VSVLSEGFLEVKGSSSVTIRDLQFQDCDFGYSNALRLEQSQELTLERVTLKNSTANFNNLIYLFQVKDLTLRTVQLFDTKKSSHSKQKSSLLSYKCLQAW
jgi:hypothetical protein